MQQLPEFTLGEFRKASASSPSQNCVSVARACGFTAIRDDKMPGASGTVPYSQLIVLTDDQFDEFQRAVRSGRMGSEQLRMARRGDGLYALWATTAQPAPGVELVFDEAEIDAFRCGILAYEFTVGPALAA